MSNVDDILFSPVSESEPENVYGGYMKGEKVPESLLKFDDPRVVCRFGVDAEVIEDESGNKWIYPLLYLQDNECVVEIIYPEKRLFNNKNNVIISIDPHATKRDPNHVPCNNIDAVRETWP